MIRTTPDPIDGARRAPDTPASRHRVSRAINCIDTDNVSVLDPASEEFRVIALPSRNIGIRKAIIDRDGRYWYMGSNDGRLVVVQ